MQLLSYDSETGQFTWRTDKSGTAKSGSIGGRKPSSNGYLRIGIDGRNRFAHRLAWLYVYGVNPDGQIDHINRIKTDNRIENLRVVTNKQNRQNSGPRRGSASGVKGVSVSSWKNKWHAQIGVDGVNISLGRFDSIEKASEAYAEAARKLHTHNYV